MADKLQHKDLSVAIIMDGNGRWGEARGLERIAGHLEGAKRVKKIVRHAGFLKLKTLTVWGFSTDNWKRSGHEVGVLMGLFHNYITEETDELDDMNVFVRFIGDRSKLPQKLQKVMNILEQKTKDNTGLTLQIALNYGGRDEIVRATNKAIELGKPVNLESFARLLDTHDEPDLVIRTSGENRTSGFLPYQTISSEWYFEDDAWPDFTPEHLDRAIYVYGKRNRRFGGVASVK